MVQVVSIALTSVQKLVIFQTALTTLLQNSARLVQCYYIHSDGKNLIHNCASVICLLPTWLVLIKKDVFEHN